MEKNEQKKSIKDIPEEDRPRERFTRYGRDALADEELLAILIRSGNHQESAIELSRRIINSFENGLADLGSTSVADLCKFKGIGMAKATSIVAAMELGRRRMDRLNKEVLTITSSQDVFEVMHPVLADLNHEEFWILFLNSANVVKGRRMISRGGLSGTVADPKIIFKIALEQAAAYIILAHNHPSGNLMPSEEDIRITKKLMEVGKIHDLPVLDHLIITNHSYYSMADEGII